MKLIMWVTAVTFVGLMVFGWGMDITGRTGGAANGGELGRVNGEPVNYTEWSALYRNLYDQQQRSRPGEQIGAGMVRQLENAAWDQVVMQKLINQELKRRGIEVTDSELKQAARFSPPEDLMDNELFKTNGQFDINKYHQFLASPGIDDRLLLQLEAYYRDVIPRSKLFYQVTSGTYVTDNQMWHLWKDAREQARARYISIDPSAVVPDASVSVSAKEIEQFYKSHPKEFKRPATARLKYVVMDRSPAPADTAAARERARQVRQEAVSGNFADVATKESADSVSARDGGNLGKIRRGQTVPAFEQAAFAAPVGQVTEPVLSPFGYHIIKVDSRTNDEAEVRHILIPITRSPEYENALLDRADTLQNLGESTSLATAAQRLGLRVREAELNDSTPFLPAVNEADEAARWAFRDAEPGETSEVFETPSVYYMVELVSKKPAGTVPLKDAKEGIEQKLKADKKLERAKEFARTLVEKIRTGATLEAVADQNSLSVGEAGPFGRLDFVPGLGRANAAIGTAFSLKPGQTSGVVEAEGTLFIIQTTEKIDADRKEFEAQKDVSRPRLTKALAEQRWTQFLTALKDEAKIVDKREEVLRRSADAAGQQQQAQQPF